MSTIPVEALVERLTSAPGRDDRLTHLEVLPPRVARPCSWPGWAAPAVVDAWRRAGVTEPWEHQAEAASLAHDGNHVVISTGTASGKSLGYLLPGLTDIVESRGPKGQRGASVLYLSPTKALAHDQLSTLHALGVPDLRAATHDGDSSPEEREWTRDHA